MIRISICQIYTEGLRPQGHAPDNSGAKTLRNFNLHFVTNVTRGRRPILVENRNLLYDAIKSVQGKAQFNMIAWVILPDHFHMIIDPMKENLSCLMRRIKLAFSRRYRDQLGDKQGRIWQYRFWDHIIRDQNDLNRHLDYIHYNPVKHGLVGKAADYCDSSFKIFIEKGYYDSSWGIDETLNIKGDFGE